MPGVRSQLFSASSGSLLFTVIQGISESGSSVPISDSQRSSRRRALTSPEVLALIRPLCNVLADVLLAQLQRRVCL